MDAWIGRQILATLYLEYKHPKNSNVEVVTLSENEGLQDWCRHIVDTVFIRAYTPRPPAVSQRDMDASTERIVVEKYLKVPKRKTVLYENCVMLAPDGEQLCSISKKKADWYLHRNLADLVQESPNIIIKLKHEPKGRGHSGSEYYLSPKQNECVSCGLQENYVRFSIVPHAYRKLMPEHVKGHSSHDIVLLCQKCHHTASVLSEPLRKILQKEVRIAHDKQPQFKIDEELRKVKYAGGTLKTHYDKLPENRRKELEELLKSYFKKESLTPEDLDTASDIEFRVKIDGDSVEQSVVNQLKTDDDYESFVRRWRKHFVDSMKPKFLPKGWDIDNPVIVRS
eukprot:TRINITY_DN5395_c0_g1_i1.p1 TRINITY_DN5395_c0_g1~~TRINITY_DN5395_c0_g1_i1.p1  ORF type:complete len:387 (+),score=75.44 TRINITY_DN5395_c0_g1_i1:145-1161(+)